MKGSVIEAKSFDFAVRIVNLYKHLTSNKNEYVLSKQLLRSGTSIGANVAEGEYAQTKADFHTKMSISLKEANETYYWLRLLEKAEYLTSAEFQSLENDLMPIIKLLTTICKKTDENIS